MPGVGGVQEIGGGGDGAELPFLGEQSSSRPGPVNQCPDYLSSQGLTVNPSTAISQGTLMQCTDPPAQCFSGTGSLQQAAASCAPCISWCSSVRKVVRCCVCLLPPLQCIEFITKADPDIVVTALDYIEKQVCRTPEDHQRTHLPDAAA